MNWKLILLPLAIPVELASVVLTAVVTGNPSECGFGNWVFDRKLGDPVGKTWQTRQQTLDEQSRSRR